MYISMLRGKHAGPSMGLISMASEWYINETRLNMSVALLPFHQSFSTNTQRKRNVSNGGKCEYHSAFRSFHLVRGYAFTGQL